MRLERVGHAAIKVRSLDVSESFYRDVLGFEVTHRFLEDDELIFGFGSAGHLLLQAVGDDAPAPDAKTLGLHHLAFVLADGERALAAVRADFERRGITYRDVDHDDHRSLYFQDPDGHTLEIYHEPEAALVRTTTDERLARARTYLAGNARLIDRRAFEVSCDGADPARLIVALDAYRNGDGAFGHALEPDLRAPTSQPLHTETALALLKDAGIRARDIAQDCCEFIASVAASDAGLPAFLPGALDYPAAAHWQAGFGAVPSLERTCGMVALLAWHGVSHSWLEFAIEQCHRHLARTEVNEAHYLRYATMFATCALEGTAQRELLARLRTMLPSAEYYVAETPVLRYGLTPLHFAPAPNELTRAWFDEATIARHLDDLEQSQLADGGWTIRFPPPTPAAAIEWRGHVTLEALRQLRAWGR
jgi:catechol 2,3-dioxygenase-like lactoylglutathione lyase family enzyme